MSSRYIQSCLDELFSGLSFGMSSNININYNSNHMNSNNNVNTNYNNNYNNNNNNNNSNNSFNYNYNHHNNNNGVFNYNGMYHNNNYHYSMAYNNANNNAIGCNVNNTYQYLNTIECFFHAISPFAHNLCTDKFGHYIIVNLLKGCRKHKIVNVLKPFVSTVIISHLQTLVHQPYPCRILQDFLQSDIIPLRVHSLCGLNRLFQQKLQPIKSAPVNHTGHHDHNHVNYPLVYQVMAHRNGNYVIQEMIRTACQLNMQNSLQYLFDTVSQNARQLSTNKFGCRAVQTCLAENIPAKCKYNIIVALLQNLAFIVNDGIGKYCIEKCFECAHACGYDEVNRVFVEEIFFGVNVSIKHFGLSDSGYTLPQKLLLKFQKYISTVQNQSTIINFSKLSFGKYSSTICDRAFQYATMNQRIRLINYLCNPDIILKCNVLFGMIHHEFGNYVIKNIMNTLLNEKNKISIAIDNLPPIHEQSQLYQQQKYCQMRKDINQYETMLSKLGETLNRISTFMNKYQNVNQNRFSFAYNVMNINNNTIQSAHFSNSAHNSETTIINKKYIHSRDGNCAD